jgi:transposase-like protein
MDKKVYEKRTQRDYSMPFKIAVVREVESGEIGVNQALRKYGIQARSTLDAWRQKFGNFAVGNELKINTKFMQTPQQKIMSLEQKIRQLEKQIDFLNEELEDSDLKAAVLDRIIYLAENELHLPVKKNFKAAQSEVLAEKGKKH